MEKKKKKKKKNKKQVTLSVRQRRAEARQGGGRSGAPKINSKRYNSKIQSPESENGITGLPWNK